VVRVFVPLAVAHVLALVLERDSVASFWLVVSIARIAVLVPVTSVFHRTLFVAHEAFTVVVCLVYGHGTKPEGKYANNRKRSPHFCTFLRNLKK